MEGLAQAEAHDHGFEVSVEDGSHASNLLLAWQSSEGSMNSSF
jgi:hypothetical protein